MEAIFTAAVTRRIMTACTEATPYLPFSTDWNSSTLATFFPGDIRKTIAPVAVIAEVKTVTKQILNICFSCGNTIPNKISKAVAPISLAAISVFSSIAAKAPLAALHPTEI